MKLPRLRPVSRCAGCGRYWYSDRRRPCDRCGSTARVFDRGAADSTTTTDSA